MKYSEIEDAFLFVNGGGVSENRVMICVETGQFGYHSDSYDLDGLFPEIPIEAYESDLWQELPHKNELDLGRDLVIAFVEQYLPNELDDVYAIFRRKGAYARYKYLLVERGMLDQWHKFEAAHEKAAILKWCRKAGIEGLLH